jgi:hypothetical protein
MSARWWVALVAAVMVGALLQVGVLLWTYNAGRERGVQEGMRGSVACAWLRRHYPGAGACDARF